MLVLSVVKIGLRLILDFHLNEIRHQLCKILRFTYIWMFAVKQNLDLVKNEMLVSQLADIISSH